MQASTKSHNASPRLISSRDVEKMMGIAPSTLQRLRKRSDFPEAIYLSPCSIRFEHAEIVAFIEARKGQTA